jgi:hypothetical protein
VNKAIARIVDGRRLIHLADTAELAGVRQAVADVRRRDADAGERHDRQEQEYEENRRSEMGMPCSRLRPRVAQR